jgi:pimeloyl-ACP methyl ester carboxylesterase
VDHPAPPGLSLLLGEASRWGLESTRLLAQLPRIIADAPRGDGHPVLVLPGYGGGDGSTLVMRYVVGRLGYQACKLELGVNHESAQDRIVSVDDAVRFREKMVALVVERVRSIFEERGEKVSLVGWSMGGLYAFDTARELPEMVRQVVTLGSPYGDPRGTSTFELLRWLKGSNVPVESQDFASWLRKAEPGDGAVPVTAIYSATDGIVSPEVARPAPAPSVECIEVEASHVGFGLNPEAFRVLSQRIHAHRPAS